MAGEEPQGEAAPEQQLEVTYELGEEDAVVGYWQGYLGHPLMRRIFFFGALLFVPAAVFAAVAVGGSPALAVVPVGGMLVLLLVLAPWRIRVQARSNPMWRGPHTTWISPQHVGTRTEGVGESQVDWKQILGVKEIPSHILIQSRGGATTLIPRAAFAAPEAAEEFLAAARDWHRAASEG